VINSSFTEKWTPPWEKVKWVMGDKDNWAGIIRDQDWRRLTRSFKTV